MATPANSAGCSAGQYVAGALIQLSVVPDPGWQIDGWTGTANDTSTAGTNTVTMPAADHTVSVTYVESTTPPPSGGVTEDFETFTLGSSIGSDSDWYDEGGGGPVITDGCGVGGTTGLCLKPGFHLDGTEFEWADPNLAGVVIGMDFQYGPYDDDRVGWIPRKTASAPIILSVCNWIPIQ